MRKIKLTQGKYAIVDDEDFEFLKQWKWQVMCGNGYWYAVRMFYRKDGKRRTMRMHRLIMKVENSKQLVDHCNHNTLNNQKSNLRIATQAQNKMNAYSNVKKKSIFKGVTKRHIKYRLRPWRARITVNKVKLLLGDFKTEVEAGRAYNQAAIKYFGEYANLNKLNKITN